MVSTVDSSTIPYTWHGVEKVWSKSEGEMIWYKYIYSVFTSKLYFYQKRAEMKYVVNCHKALMCLF